MRAIRLDQKKELSLLTWAVAPLKFPSKIVLPLSVRRSGNPQLLIKPGDFVKAGQKLTQSSDPEEVPLRASVSGKILSLASLPHPVWGEAPAVEILTETREEAESWNHEKEGWQFQPLEECLDLFRDLGIVTLDRFSTPLHVKIMEDRVLCPEVLVVHASDSEPYVTSRHALVMSYPLDILKGADLLARLLGVKRVEIVMQEGMGEALELLKSKIYFLKWDHFVVREIPALYPQEMFFSERTVYDAATVFAAYEAAAKGKPLLERVVTVSGECVVEPRNMWVRFGTSFGDAVKVCRGLLREPGRLIMGGPMQGIPQAHLNVPVIPSTSAILALSKEVSKPEDAEPCIRCGRCIEVCPVEISPVMITLAAEKDDFEGAQNFGAGQCIECGNCAYICPSKRPMVDLIRYANQENRYQEIEQEPLAPQPILAS